MERLLDVSQLEPPEPLERILAETPQLASGDHLHVLLCREPFPLYPLLNAQGLVYHTEYGEGGMFHIHIWDPLDTEADQQVRELISDDAG